MAQISVDDSAMQKPVNDAMKNHGMTPTLVDGEAIEEIITRGMLSGIILRLDVTMDDDMKDNGGMLEAVDLIENNAVLRGMTVEIVCDSRVKNDDTLLGSDEGNTVVTTTHVLID